MRIGEREMEGERDSRERNEREGERMKGAAALALSLQPGPGPGQSWATPAAVARGGRRLPQGGGKGCWVFEDGEGDSGDKVRD